MVAAAAGLLPSDVVNTRAVEVGSLSEAERRRFRAVLGHFASGVTVITGTTPAGPAGFTCQSFSSLSIDPPLVLVLPGRSSSSWPVIADSGGFCVNVLAQHQESLSVAFARSGTDKFAGVDWASSPLGSPVLTGASAWIDCAIAAVHPGGDHLIVVGAVEDLGATEDSSPLVFHRGGYLRATSPLTAARVEQVQGS